MNTLHSDYRQALRSEYAANVALQAPRGSQAWLKASTCRRPARRSLIARLLASLGL
jgi:hypothetical protein